MYNVEYTPEAFGDLKSFRKFEQQQIIDQITVQLSFDPKLETRKRKRLRPNNVSEFELRIAKFRVFYDVAEIRNIVKISAIGHKEGNRLFIRGKEYPL